VDLDDSQAVPSFIRERINQQVINQEAVQMYHAERGLAPFLWSEEKYPPP
jgi:hypothetical protein